MDWRIKAAIQGTLSRLPAAERGNSILQRATGSYAVSPDKVPAAANYARQHLRNVDTFSRHGREQSKYFEFGAGWGLQGPIAMYLLGAGGQVVYDLHRHVRRRFIETTLDTHRASPIEDSRRPLPPAHADVWADLQEMHIDYRAPADARETHLASDSVDVVTSTNTLEHIPVEDIRTILSEMLRILGSDGLLSMQIDYKDHYSYNDPAISTFNFLRYSPTRWKLANNALHFQNRLRHHQYLELLSDGGFDVVDAQIVEASEEDLDALCSMPLDTEFAASEPRALGIREAFLVARPRG